MATTGHFAKFKGFKIDSKHAKLNQTYMEKMIVRQPQDRLDKLHPDAKKKYNAMMQEPKPLSYKLHEWPLGEAKTKIESIMEVRRQRVEAGEMEETPDLFAAKSMFVPLNNPLGTLEDLPFQVERTHKGNLPVYTDTRAGGQRKVTVVRKIFGDVEAF